MNSSSITREQAEKLSAAIREHLGYLVRLRTRMELRGFPSDDPLYLLVCRAFDAVHRLSVELHYMSCGSGVCRPS